MAVLPNGTRPRRLCPEGTASANPVSGSCGGQIGKARHGAKRVAVLVHRVLCTAAWHPDYGTTGFPMAAFQPANGNTYCSIERCSLETVQFPAADERLTTTGFVTATSLLVLTKRLHLRYKYIHSFYFFAQVQCEERIPALKALRPPSGR